MTTGLGKCIGAVGIQQVGFSRERPGTMSKRQLTEQDLVEALARANRTQNPNPRRRGCPPRAALEQLARFRAGEVVVEKATLLHLADCWPCAQELKELRTKKS
jgi:hypothetical protein